MVRLHAGALPASTSGCDSTDMRMIRALGFTMTVHGKGPASTPMATTCVTCGGGGG